MKGKQPAEVSGKVGKYGDVSENGRARENSAKPLQAIFFSPE